MILALPGFPLGHTGLWNPVLAQVHGSTARPSFNEQIRMVCMSHSALCFDFSTNKEKLLNHLVIKAVFSLLFEIPTEILLLLRSF